MDFCFGLGEDCADGRGDSSFDFRFLRGTISVIGARSLDNCGLTDLCVGGFEWLCGRDDEEISLDDCLLRIEIGFKGSVAGPIGSGTSRDEAVPWITDFDESRGGIVRLLKLAFGLVSNL
jgi:hypothetical protein